MMKMIKFFLKKVEFIDDKSYLLEGSILREIFTVDFLEMDFETKMRTPMLNKFYDFLVK